MTGLYFKVTNNGYTYEVNLFDKKELRENFWNNYMRNDYLSFPSTINIDLLYLSEIIYYCDRKFLREYGLDGWKRSFELEIPVRNFEKFNKLEKKISQMLNFLTGDIWNLTFKQREKTTKEKTLEKYFEGRTRKILEHVCMFSGGLDSFIGVSDLISNKQYDFMFVSHYGGGKGTLEYQEKLKRQIIKQEPKYNNFNFFQFYLASVGGKEDTTRSRSFMFFSHALAIANSVSANTLIIPENGFISLNVPLTSSRKGSSSTRTTHPYYFNLFQEIITELELNIEIKNPYQFKTKGQMIEEAINKDFIRDNITNTMSCSHPDQGRYSGLSIPVHCGYCLPCSIRRAAIQKGLGKDETKYRFYKYETKEATQNFNALRMAVNASTGIIPEFKIQENGIVKDKLKEYSIVYKNGVQELGTFLEGIK